MMSDQSKNAREGMEWSTGPLNWNGYSNLRNFMQTSTPLRFRPLPPASPNLSMIFRPDYTSFKVSLHFSNFTDSGEVSSSISGLARRFAKIKLE